MTRKSGSNMDFPFVRETIPIQEPITRVVFSAHVLCRKKLRISVSSNIGKPKPQLLYEDRISGVILKPVEFSRKKTGADQRIRTLGEDIACRPYDYRLW